MIGRNRTIEPSCHDLERRIVAGRAFFQPANRSTVPRKAEDRAGLPGDQRAYPSERAVGHVVEKSWHVERPVASDSRHGDPVALRSGKDRLEPDKVTGKWVDVPS